MQNPLKRFTNPSAKSLEHELTSAGVIEPNRQGDTVISSGTEEPGPEYEFVRWVYLTGEKTKTGVYKLKEDNEKEEERKRENEDKDDKYKIPFIHHLYLLKTTKEE